MPLVRFTQNLNQFFPELKPFNCEQSTVENVLNEADSRFPGISNYILNDQGELREHIQVFVGGRMIVDREGLSDLVDDHEEVLVMQALSGG